MREKTKIGIYGGTFSPPHNGHLHAADVFLKEIALDRLLIIPDYIPPHKEIECNNPTARLEMAKLAFSSLSEYGKKVFVDDYEITSGGKSYTAETLLHFCSSDTELYFLCGTDMFLTIDSWYHPEIICKLSTIVLMRRENDPENTDKINSYITFLQDKYDAKVIIMKSPAVDISSSEIRKYIKNNRDISHFVPKKVEEYIKENKLYI